ncbi:uncharacterized protein LOC119721731 [Patiria miniata]|uniref:Uncharacterized protein n=1 Tax=Patiria miniata TaxID=46514 RepID=A0A913Z9E0_PATMI|nr:uncharacterized protein LOC119721731 [Patiria miniata]
MSTVRQVNPFGLQFSLQAQATTVNERPSLNKQSSDFRFGRDQQSNTYRSLSENTGVPLPGRRYSQPLTKDGEGHERQSSATYSGAMEHRSAPRHRQVHHPATAYAAQLTDLTQPEVMSHHSNISEAQEEDSFNPYVQQTPRLVHSAGAVHTRHHKGIMHIPGNYFRDLCILYGRYVLSMDSV